jgi:hypothetical protein
LRELLADPGLPTRCRRAAEKHYALDSACEVQAALYRELVSPASIGLRETRF